MAFADDRISSPVADPIFIAKNGGRSLMIIMYKNEMGSSSFEKQLKNSLDETPVKNISTIDNGQNLNIEDTVDLAYKEFNKYLPGKAS
jgi:hypothetical protein